MMGQAVSRNPDHYRPCVGIALFKDDGRVWMGKRYGQKGPYTWQFPQGGIDPREAPEHAAIRELWEETGLTYADILPLGEIGEWLYYDFPEAYKSRKIAQGWRGQRQMWYAFRFTGRKRAFDLKAHPPQEFSKWGWKDLSDAPNMIVPFKRDVYERLASDFARFAKPVK